MTSRSTSLVAYATLALAACAYDALPPLGAGTRAKLVFSVPPATAFVQQPLEGIQISISDPQGRLATSATDEITLALGDNPGGSGLLGQTKVKARAGIATFRVGVNRPGNGYTLVASATGFDAVNSAPFTAKELPFTLVDLWGGDVRSLAVAPAAPGGMPAVYAAVGNGVYRSTSRGFTWTRASFGLTGGPAMVVADPRNPAVLYAAGGGGEFFFVKKTSTSGEAWFDPSDGKMFDTSAESLVVDPKNPSTLYVAGFDAKLYRSADGGANWTSVAMLPFRCPQLAIDPITTQRLYCRMSGENGLSKGIYRSTDGGSSWVQITSGLGPPEIINSVVAAPNAVFAIAVNAIYRSIDGGNSWTGTTLSGPQALAYAPSAPSRVYLAMFEGVAVSDDGGATFGPPVAVAIDLGDTPQALAVDPIDHQIAYLGTQSGVFVSPNGGMGWARSSTGITAPNVRSVAMAPDAPGTIVAATGEGIFQTINGGGSWVQSSFVREGVVRFDPAAPERVLVCGNGTFTELNNHGASIASISEMPTRCSGLALTGSTVVASGSEGTAISNNGGANWTKVGDGTLSYDVALGDTLGTVMVTSSPKGLARSVNGGASFEDVSSDFALSLLTDPTMPTRIIAGLTCGETGLGAHSTGGFRVSTDGGQTFGAIKPGLCVQRLSHNGSALYAASFSAFEVSTDHGETWKEVSIGPVSSFITSIAASADGNTIYLGTAAGLYKSTTGGL